jgi:hypothetical protein
MACGCKCSHALTTRVSETSKGISSCASAKGNIYPLNTACWLQFKNASRAVVSPTSAHHAGMLVSYLAMHHRQLIAQRLHTRRICERSQQRRDSVSGRFIFGLCISTSAAGCCGQRQGIIAACWSNTTRRQVCLENIWILGRCLSQRAAGRLLSSF